MGPLEREDGPDTVLGRCLHKALRDMIEKYQACGELQCLIASVFPG